VEAVRGGEARRSVARRYRVALSTVQFWLQRAEGLELDAVDWNDQSSAPLRTRRVVPAVEAKVLRARQHLRDRTALGEFGAAAIHAYLSSRDPDTPSVRTIGRILDRRGALDGAVRVRRPAPPPGWYLPDVAARRAELDSFDTVMGLVIEGGPEVEVLNAVSLHGGVVASWVTRGITARATVGFLVEHWRSIGLPRYAQFDNDTRFQGAHQHADTFGRVTRLCLSLGVTPVFSTPREHGFQNLIEGYNGRWQAKVWSRFHHRSLAALRARSDAYVAAHRGRNVDRADRAPPRRQFPAKWTLDLQAPLRGRVVYLRRASDAGVIEMLGHRIVVAPHWPHRLVRAELDLDHGTLRFHALRRRAPDQQPLLQRMAYRPPTRPFIDRDE
jgi:hypothetical protein